MNRPLTIWLNAAFFLTVSTFLGCGRSDRPATYKVSGLVTLDGKALEGASVSFLNKENGPYNAVAITDSNGKYQLTTFEAGDGAVEGSFVVTVTKYGREKEVSPYEVDSSEIAAQASPGKDNENYASAYGKAMEGGSKKGWKPPKTWNDVPDKYATGNTSGLSFDVKPLKEGNTFDIILQK